MYKLRELERKDIEKINKWRNDPELIACLGAPYRYINEEVDNEWYNSYLGSRGKAVRCAIVDAGNEEEILGLISLVSIDNINRSAELHIMIGRKENQGKGLGTFAVNTMIEHAFLNLNLRRIELSVLATNVPAIKLYEKVGFSREGVKVQSHYKAGKYIDMIIMAKLRKEE